MQKESNYGVNSSSKYPISSKTFVCIGLVVEGYREEGLQLTLLGFGLLGIRDAIRKVEKV